MDDQERLSFESALTASKELLEQTYLINDLKKQLLTENSAQDRKEFVGMLNKPAAKGRSMFLYWAVAAIAVILIPIILLFNQPGADDLFVAYYQPYPISQVSRDAGGQKLSEGLSLYHQERYSEAIVALEAVTDPSSATKLENLAIACSYLSLKQSNEALSWLLPLTNSANDTLREHADWYTALAYLQSEQEEPARKALQQIAESKSIWAVKATNLLNELD